MALRSALCPRLRDKQVGGVTSLHHHPLSPVATFLPRWGGQGECLISPEQMGKPGLAQVTWWGSKMLRWR